MGFQSLGRIQAADPTPAAVAAASDGTDQTLPDPTHIAVAFLGGAILAALVVAIAMNAFGFTGKPFKPSTSTGANFDLFAGFYVAAQVIERLMQLVAPSLPWWSIPDIADPTAKAAQIKADRAMGALGVAAVLGVLASCGFGLYFLAAIGIHTSHTVDAFLTGITIAAGTKPLHDFIGLLQNQNSPKTGTTAP